MLVRRKNQLHALALLMMHFVLMKLKSFEVFEKIVRRRTVYITDYLKEAYENGYLVILFKYFVNLSEHIPLERAIEEKILNGAPQSIQRLSDESFIKIVSLSRSDKQIKNIILNH